ncbi:hypothetical protein Pint_09597 [Pistacia integerrima]|uniref:Uncharacterized protein n=1 Tax=Pistacia integerrima TaxID=434235 RepID=A0ACC0XLX8_9ROSI|nr:hypothetical protein Pint_09597 [Pistacia integerrima]
MYSWWWDSHISPKNFKWLQENLTAYLHWVKDMIMQRGTPLSSSNNGEAFPNQIPFAMGDDGDPRTPEMGPKTCIG